MFGGIHSSLSKCSLPLYVCFLSVCCVCPAAGYLKSNVKYMLTRTRRMSSWECLLWECVYDPLASVEKEWRCNFFFANLPPPGPHRTLSAPGYTAATPACLLFHYVDAQRPCLSSPCLPSSKLITTQTPSQEGRGKEEIKGRERKAGQNYM